MTSRNGLCNLKYLYNCLTSTTHTDMRFIHIKFVNKFIVSHPTQFHVPDCFCLSLILKKSDIVTSMPDTKLN
jgi:hypothetical protein